MTLFRLKLKKLENWRIYMNILSFNQNYHISHQIFDHFRVLIELVMFFIQCSSLKLKKIEFEEVQFWFESSSSFGFKLESNKIKNNQNILGISEFQTFESSGQGRRLVIEMPRVCFLQEVKFLLSSYARWM